MQHKNPIRPVLNSRSRRYNRRNAISDEFMAELAFNLVNRINPPVKDTPR